MIKDIPIQVRNAAEVAPLKPEFFDAVSNALQAHKETPGGLLPIFHAIQDTLGHVPMEALPMIGKQLNLSRADVYGVLSFYHHFRTEPGGEQTVYVCRAEACQAMGAATLEQQIKEYLQVDFHETTADGKYSLEPVYCLGNCACAPSIRVGDEVIGRMTKTKIDTTLGGKA